MRKGKLITEFPSKEIRGGCDVDNVLLSYDRSVYKFFGRRYRPSTKWNPKFLRNTWPIIKESNIFWRRMISMIDPKDFPETMRMFISAYPEREAVHRNRKLNLLDVGLPDIPLFGVGVSDKAVAGSKGEIVIKHKLDYFVDDKPQHYNEVTEAGVLCFLFDMPYNRHVKTKYRITNLSQIRDFNIPKIKY